MKVFLDDDRKTPEGWERTYSVTETIALLETGLVEELSLDHDLGLTVERVYGRSGEPLRETTGYDVLLWLEAKVVNEGFVPPIIYVHSANPSARVKMHLAVETIKRLHRQNASARPSDAS